MKIGFIGAGKVGFSLGRYFAEHGLEVTGYYDSEMEAAKEAAEFTKTKHYRKLEQIVCDSDALFLTVPDGRISTVWNNIKPMPLEGRIICHCSGALTARDAFSGISKTGVLCASVHPLFAVSDKYHSYKELDHSYFTLEGDKDCVEQLKLMFTGFGNGVKILESSKKTLYHAAAAICSNLVTALADESIHMMENCGFQEEMARDVLKPIMCGNLEHVAQNGTKNSLTGPVERGDLETIQKHLECMEGQEDKILYSLLSKRLTAIAEKKNPDRDYTSLKCFLEEVLQDGYRIMSTGGNE
ncbi:MAG: DUF2520 domain-containing protein [Lachnospiraceae bacterium]|nr:DUF2520 domain-containing protein [Lachnospiraceae bacterium]